MYGRPPSEGASEGDEGNPGEGSPSLDVPGTWVPVSSSLGTASRGWTYTSTETLEACAEKILVSMRDRGAELHEAGYLDLLGNAWGCACALPRRGGAFLATVSAADDAPTRIDLVELRAAEVEEVLP